MWLKLTPTVKKSKSEIECPVELRYVVQISNTDDVIIESQTEKLF